jgi:hypothetical protein
MKGLDIFFSGPFRGVSLNELSFVSIEYASLEIIKLFLFGMKVYLIDRM